MKLSKQLFLGNYHKPQDYSQAKTSKLMSNGVITYNLNRGIPFYLPIGKKILKKLQDLVLNEAENQDMDEISVPYLVKDEILESGEDLTETFSKRIIRLKNFYLIGFHLRTTPEPSILNLSNMSQLTHTQLPIRYVFNVESFMGVQKPKNILRGRQFNSFIGASLNGNEKSLDESFDLFENLAENIFRKLNVIFLKVKEEGGKKVEFFYETPEGDNILTSSIRHGKIKGISLGMIYDYNSKNGKRIRFRDITNKNQDILYCTFGLGIQRVLYAMMDSNRDSRGFDLKSMAPFNFSIIPLNKNFIEKSLEVYKTLQGDNVIDDRKNNDWVEKVAFSDYTGIPYKIIIDNESYTLKDRSESESRSFKTLEKLVDYIKSGIM